MPQVTVTMTFASEAEAAAFLGGATKTSPSEVKDPKPGKPAKTETPAVSPSSAAPTPAPTAAPAAAPTPAPSPSPAAAADTGGDYLKSGIPELIQQYVAKDRAGAIALLGKFNVKKGAELKPEQFAEFKTAIEAALAPAGDDLS
jgi:hypothetical protein